MTAVAGCGNADPVETPDGTTSGAGSATVSDGSSSGGTSSADVTTAGQGATETSGGPVGSGNARLLVAGTQDGTSGLFYLEYVAGALLEPVLVSDPSDAGLLVDVVALSPSREFAGFVQDAELGWRVADLRDGLPNTPVAAMMPAGSYASPYFEFPAGGEAIVYETDTMTSTAAVWTAPLDGGAPGAAELVAEPPTPDHVMVALREIAEDGSWMLVEAGDASGEGPNNIFLASLSDPDPGALVPISDLDGPDQFAESATVLPGDIGLIYRAERDAPGEDLWIVALDDGLPAAPVRINDPLVPPQDLWGVMGIHVSPAGNGLVYWIADLAGDETGHLQWVALDGADPAPPVALDGYALDVAQASRVTISPNGRWIVFEAEDAGLDTQALWLVDVATGAPTDPVRVAGPVEDASVSFPMFEPSSTYLYYYLTTPTSAAELQRIDIGDGKPAEPQSVSGDVSDHDGVGRAFTFSEDYGLVALATGDDSNLLYVVDVSGAEPSSPTVIELPLAADRRIKGAWFSVDSSVVLVGATMGDGLSSDELWLVDLTDTVAPALIFDEMQTVRSLPN